MYTQRSHCAYPCPSDTGCTETHRFKGKRTNDRADKGKSKMLCTICRKKSNSDGVTIKKGSVGTTI